MKRIFLSLGFLLVCTMVMRAQDTAGNRALTMAEYEKAKTFTVGDPDKDTYVKFENAYILDHSGFGKPYFITGDDGKKETHRSVQADPEGRQGGTGHRHLLYHGEMASGTRPVLPGLQVPIRQGLEKVFRRHSRHRQAGALLCDEAVLCPVRRSWVIQLYRSATGRAGCDRSAGRPAPMAMTFVFPVIWRSRMAGRRPQAAAGSQAGDDCGDRGPCDAYGRHGGEAVKELTVHDAKNYAITRLVLLAAVPGRRGDRVWS
jgi:hypothetical protein